MPLKQVWLKFTCLLLLQSWADLLDGANYMCMFQAHLESNICCFWNALKYANISYNEENLIFFLIRNPRMALKAKHDFSRGTPWICCMSWEDGRRTGNLPVPFGLNVHQPRQKTNRWSICLLFPVGIYWGRSRRVTRKSVGLQTVICGDACWCGPAASWWHTAAKGGLQQRTGELKPVSPSVFEPQSLKMKLLLTCTLVK